MAELETIRVTRYNSNTRQNICTNILQSKIQQENKSSCWISDDNEVKRWETVRQSRSARQRCGAACGKRQTGNTRESQRQAVWKSLRQFPSYQPPAMSSNSWDGGDRKSKVSISAHTRSTTWRAEAHSQTGPIRSTPTSTQTKYVIWRMLLQP